MSDRRQSRVRKPFIAEASATTKAPLAKASAAIIDPANYPKWFKGAHAMRPDGYPKEGGVLSWKIAWMGTASTFVARVTENALPRRLVARVKTPSGESDITHTFEATPDGTRYTKRVVVEGGVMLRFLMSLFLRRSVRQEVEAAARMADGVA